LAKVLEAYRAVTGVEVAEEKTAEFATDFTLLGTEVRGGRGTAGAPEARRRVLVQLCAAVVRRRRCDRKTLERILGAAIPVLQRRRECS